MRRGLKAVTTYPVEALSTRADALSFSPPRRQTCQHCLTQTNSTKLITVNTTGTGTGGGFPPFSGFFDHGVELSISADGRFVAFMSQQSGLVTNDTNGNGDDIFLYNIATQSKSL